MKFISYAGSIMVASLIAPLVAADQPLVAAEIKMPRIVNAQEQTRVVSPERHHQVAVMNIIINADKGKAKSVELKSIKVINSYSPKVFSRQTKADTSGWRVTLNGDTTTSYMVNSPLSDIEIENPEGSKSPYSMVLESGPVEWTLVIPLYRDGKLLNVKQVVIEDSENRDIKLSARIDSNIR